MNNPSEFELDQDLQLLPAWARQPSSVNRYANYPGAGEEPRERRRGADRPFRRDRAREAGTGERRPGPRREARPDGPAPVGQPPGKARPGPRRPEPPKEPEVPLPEVLVNLIPEKEGVELLARQIRLTGRAYPLFQIAGLILKHPDRFHVQFHVKKGVDGQVLQPLFVCSLDETVWLSEEEVAQHVLRHHFDTFYQTEKVPCDPPKGTYTLVAQCGLSGVILGPPNYHDYQNKLRKLHSERFAHMPFEAYKARVKIVKDEAVVKKWLEEQSWKAEYIGLNLPEPLRFTDREQVEQHFRQTHLPNLIKNVESHTLTTPESHRFMSRGLRALMRHAIEEQRRFPLKVATQLSQQLAAHGLQFFKVNKTVVHVCVARPHYLDLTTATVSDRVRRIMEFIETHPGCNRRQLIDTLAPAPPPPPAPAPVSPGAGEPGQVATGTAPAAVPPSEPGPTPEQTAIIADLHWLIHQGHVIEFTDGRMETAKPPKPKPAPAPKTETPKAEIPGTAAATAESTSATAAASSAAGAQAGAAVETPAHAAGGSPPAETNLPGAETGKGEAATPADSPAPAAPQPEATVETPAATAQPDKARAGDEGSEKLPG
jgi:hypothetical protein